jgi:uncharacterized membrane protein YbaN (DUF454 family)
MALRRGGCREAGRVVLASRRVRGSGPRLSPAHGPRQDHSIPNEEQDWSGSMSFNSPSRETDRDSAGAIAWDTPEPGCFTLTPVTVAAPSPYFEHGKGRAERHPHATRPWVRCCEEDGVIEIRDPRLLRPDRAAFCRALVEAAVAHFGAWRAQVRMESSTCRVQFEPGRFAGAEMAGRVAAAVRAATPSVRGGVGRRDDAGAGESVLTALATDGLTSPRAIRGGSPDVPASVAAPTGSRHLADLALAGASFALAVGGVILPGIPTFPFLILTGRYAVRVSPRIEHLLMGQPWSAALLTEVEIPSGPTLDWQSLWKRIGLVVLFTAGSLILNPPLPIVLGLEFGLFVFLGWRELDRGRDDRHKALL